MRHKVFDEYSDNKEVLVNNIHTFFHFLKLMCDFVLLTVRLTAFIFLHTVKLTFHHMWCTDDGYSSHEWSAAERNIETKHKDIFLFCKF